MDGYELIVSKTNNVCGSLSGTLIPLTTTENGDKAFATTGSSCLDFFVRITRSADVYDFVNLYGKCLAEDYETAIKILFNLRDIRDGKGEKLIPIVLMVCLKQLLPNASYELLLREFLKYGCWKDLLRIAEITLRLDPKLSVRIEVEMFANQLSEDCSKVELFNLSEKTENTKSVAISLCGKWAPSESSHFNKKPLFLADRIRTHMKITSKKFYRQMLSTLRSHLNILERHMSLKEYDKIDFSSLPSVAHMKNKNAFKRDTNAKGEETEDRKNLHHSYDSYLMKLTKGDKSVKVNTKGLQPHEIIESYLTGKTKEVDLLFEAQWETLVAKTKEAGIFKNTLAIVDTSGSMAGQPLHVAIALGLLVLECSDSADKKVLTFNTNPRWHTVNGSTLREKVHQMNYSDWGGSTNMEASLNLILQDAVNRKLSPDQMTSKLIIFTDMQFDSVHSSGDRWLTTFQKASQSFEQAGYKLPHIVCWNLRTSSSKSLPVTAEENGFSMMSGFSNEMLKHVLNGESMTPISLMLHSLEAYTAVDLSSANLSAFPYDLDQLSKAITESKIKPGSNKKKMNK